ncbi:MAG: hypothetical protein QOF62_3067 [Pyrinomonadaceae bacterium]|jgi:RHS repeat-associated protein|nr:hypothetical protein [Pyrinomonadaceae bacterium]
MFQTRQFASTRGVSFLWKTIAYALILLLSASATVGQLATATPSGVPVQTPPLRGPSHDPGALLPPPHPPNGVPAATLPNIAAARNLAVQPLPIPTPFTPIFEMRCDYDCGGDDPPPAGGSDPDFSTARVRSQNETGQAGVDLGSRNFNWSLPLVSLSGRAGLDLNLSLYYNSLVWTHEGSSIRYNSDRAFPGPGPGFSLGLPKLQQRYLNQDFGVYAYMLVSPSGGHVELRQVGASNTYEAADSSYTQLIDNGASKLLRTKDGSQYSFVPSVDGEFRCTEMKDRNGNYISASYNSNSDISTVTDTLGRVVTFNYDSANYLLSIAQTWTVNGQAQTHLWATFGYGTLLVQTNFPGLFVQGPNNANIPVLASVTLADNSSYNFDYTSWGQVYQIRQNAADGHMRSRQTYNLPQDATTAQSECPRFTERRDWAEYWMEVVTQYSVDPNVGWTQETQPDGTVYKEYFATAGWQNGLTVRTEIYAAGDPSPRKWTTIDWTQDDINVPYQLNPRPTETNIYDSSGNRRRTTIEYNSGFGLPTHVREFAADGQTLLRMTAMAYKMDADYIDRRIIGLPYERLVYDGPSGNPVARMIFHYDWGDPYFVAEAPATNYADMGYVTGRGNLVAVRRYNCATPASAYDENQAVWFQLNHYNMAGSRVWIEDASWHRTYLSYGDSFSDAGNSRNTLAFVTQVTDHDGNPSALQYNYDFGAVTRTQDAKGAVAMLTYDAIGRPARVTNAINGAYTRWVYPNEQTYVESFSTIQQGAGEAYALKVLDGLERVYMTATSMPDLAQHYSAQAFRYNAMGLMEYQSNPTEVTGTPANSWAPSGDDATVGWQWTQQSYDYKGRPTVTTNPDGTYTEAVYGGCGCAGGDVATLKDESGRRRRISNDVLGRQTKVEELNWDQTVYSTSTFAYNARDQITNITQQNDRMRSFDYDGHGRLWHRTTPEQGTTTYSYYDDDTVQTVTDARGATQTFSYNGRHLPTNINYGAPAGVEPTPNIAFGYDQAGNRIWMTDGLGRVDYSYNTLSQMTSETRQINGLGSYPLNYEYNLGGELTRITNLWNMQVGYNYDASGRLTGVTGVNYAGVSSFINSISYRAFGGVKTASYGDGRTLSTAYDERLRLTKWDVANVLGYSYTYNNTYFHELTSKVSYAQNIYDGTLDRSYEYDQFGRLTVSHSGAEARAAAFTGQWGTQDGPYSQGYGYDVWGNITSRAGWGGWNASYTAAFNNKNQMITNPGLGTAMQYDAAGNMTNDGWQTFTYDATGAQVQAPSYGVWQGHDGDGLRVQKQENGSTTYYLRSSVLGGQVALELDASGQWIRGYVYQGEQLLAVQEYSTVYWVHQDPLVKSQRLTTANGSIAAVVELDPWGADTNRNSNESLQRHRFTTYERDWTGDESLFRRYHGWWSRFAHPDPSDASYSLSDPQSFNRYAYTQNDPVNFVDPTGLIDVIRTYTWARNDFPWDFFFRSFFGNGQRPHPIAREPRERRERPEPQKPNTPAKTNPQQKDFDDCATKANRRYRSEYLRTSTKAMAGGAGVAAGWFVGGLAFKGAMHAAGDVALPAFARILTTGIELGDSGVIVTISSYVSGKAALDAIREGERNSNRRTSEIEDCKKSFPNANHSFSTLNF